MSINIFEVLIREIVKKERIFYGQADCKGERGSAPSALSVSKCENFDPFSIENLEGSSSIMRGGIGDSSSWMKITCFLKVKTVSEQI